MPDPLPLPGLERLMSLLASHGEDVRLRAPEPAAPRAGKRVLGAPMDPELAAVYARFEEAELGALSLWPRASLDSQNARLRRSADERGGRLLCYGDLSGTPTHLATVPALADAQGLQPVVLLVNDAAPCLLPFASTVDRAFERYAQYCERWEETRGGSLARLPALDRARVLTSADLLQWVARDEALVRLLRQGAFEELVLADPESHAWSQRLLRAARDLN